MGKTSGPLIVGLTFVFALGLAIPCQAADESQTESASAGEPAQQAQSESNADPFLEFEGAVSSLKVSLPYCGKTHRRHGRQR